ncbi:MAG: sulfite exporter TauE/SafE family protein [Chitinophagales bacterium]|nr:sulfite exporter TauE/SafE family protein [Chitinophagaceae bacterium]MCB9063503.1 sulfite exporter TauE/SafE family protein [Chitinophagales bacterium]
MDTTYIIAALLIGLVAGFMSSMLGIGGGVVIVPALVLIFGMSQKMAQGTSLAVLSFPVALVAAYNYHKAGYTDWKIALLMIGTFVLGGYLGSKLVVGLDMTIVKKIFAILMIVLAVKYLFFDK